MKNIQKIFLLITSIVFLSSCSINPASEPNGDIIREIFRVSQFYNEGDEYVSQGFDSGYCLGAGGGQEQGQPCVWLLPNYDYREGKNGESCFSVQYIPEVNYVNKKMNLEKEKRLLRFPINDGRWEVWICGKFVKAYGVGRNPNPNSVADWEFKTNQYVVNEIQKQLRKEGYAV